MSSDNQLKKFLGTLGLDSLAPLVPDDLVRELETVLADMGGADGVLAGKVPPPPPPQPNSAFAIPDPPIAAGEIAYTCSDEQNGTISPVSPISISTHADTLENTPVWRIHFRAADGIPVETVVVVRAADLRLMRYEGSLHLAQFSSVVVGEYVYTRMRVHKGPRTKPRVRLPESAFLDLPSLWAALAAAPLERGWWANVHLYRADADGEWRYVPLRLEVAGEERVTTPVGDYDCWIVTAQGMSGERTVGDRYWVSRGDPSTRVVARAHERHPTGSVRRYELATLQRAREASEQPTAASAPQPAAASFELTLDTTRREFNRVRMTRPTAPLAADIVQKHLDSSMERVPPIELLRAAGRIPPGTPAEAIARYERERAEYAEDMRARIEMHDVWTDHWARRFSASAIVRVESDEPRPTHVRLTVPSRVVMELPGETYHMDQVQPPRPLSAPPDDRRKRFARRLRLERERLEGDYPSEKFVGHDSSNVVVLGPVAASRARLIEINLTFAFATWDEVAPFTLTYDIAVEGMEAVTGSVPIDVFKA